MEANRIVSNAPQSVFEALEIAQGELQQISLIQTSLLRYVVPEWGGPEAKTGEQVSYAAIAFLKTVPLEKLLEAPRRQEHYFERIQASKACRRRNRFYLKQFLEWVQQKRWLRVHNPDHCEPQFNRFNRPKGQRRIYANDLRTTSLKHPKAYALGTQEEDYVWLEGQKVLANPCLERELQEVKEFGSKFRKPKQVKQQITHLKTILGYLHRVEHVALERLCLNLLIPCVQLRFSKEDFAGTEAFAVNARGLLLDPIKAEQTLAMTESMAQRQAKKKADVTIKIVEAFFDWRQSELAQCGQPDGLSPASKREVLGAVILASKAQFREETDPEETDNFEDVSVIRRLRLRINQEVLDTQKTQKQIRKRSVPWEQAMKVFEQQRLQTLEYHIASRDRHGKAGKVVRQRAVTSIAIDFQKTVVCGLMTLIPTDRQQTYRDLETGKTLRNGSFLDEDCEEFVDQGIPTDPNQAQFWINLENFKTAETYGEFWYPVPNVQFVDGTTFYQYIVGFLWGFEDEKGVFPTYHQGEHKHWQGVMDQAGKRCGWRAALKPQHDKMFSMPVAKTPFDDVAFCSMIRALFVRFTQESGKAVPVTPHSFRHMLSTYLDKLGVAGKEEQSFAYVLHHSPEVHQGKYVYKDNMSRIAPAVTRMNEIIRSLI
ncbi:MAG: hypothetical protein KME45_32120 [Stenomitos rutilans HA7619-LM2]|jgi:uncharacterized DUF497 family protein|nr:hypothetical protein [Stenomitos rutilans HA7619-LM2]